MRSIRFAMALIIFSFVLGCDNKSKDSEGYCTQAFVSDYNTVVLESQITESTLASNFYTLAEKVSNLTSLQNTCNNFSISHSGVICRAQVASVVTSISERDLKPACDLASRELQQMGIQTGIGLSGPMQKTPVGVQAPDAIPTPDTIPTPVPTPILPDDSDSVPAPVPSIPSPLGADPLENIIDIPAQQIKIEVKNVELFKKALLIEDMVIVSGKVGTVESLAESFAKAGLLCFIGSPQKQDWENKIVFGEQFSAVKTEEDPSGERRRFSIVLENIENGIVIGCVKKSKEAFTIKEVRKTLEGIANLNIQN